MLAQEKDYRESADYQADREYWSEYLADLPEPPRLAGKAPFGPASSVLRHTAYLSSEEAQAFERLAHDHRVRFSGMMTAAAALYLSLVTGDPEVVLGLALSARTTPALKNMPATVSNIAILRIAVEPAMSFAQLIHRTARELAAALEHQRYRVEDVARDLNITTGTRSLFGLQVNFMGFTRKPLHFGEFPAAADIVTAGLVNDAALDIYDMPAATSDTRIDVNGNADLYDSAGLIGHQERFLALLHTLATMDPETPLHAVDLLDAAERDQVLRTWNDTTMPVPDTTVGDLFAAQAAATPDAVAVIADGQELSYAQVAARAGRVAQELATRGVGPDVVVAVVLPRSADLVVALVGILQAGGAYVVVDPAYPPARIAHVFGDAAPRVVVTDAAIGAGLPAADAAQLLIDDLDDGALPAVTAGQWARPRPANLAYVIYTSGTTGVPKGVAISHASMLNLVSQPVCAAGPGERVLAHSAVTFDASVYEMWPALTGGAAVVLTAAARSDLDEIAAL
ncbi:MAG: AMP-binding protein, partial [Mycobacterium sp.]|nr:AMP-binding protein [Mycobacterium sp.]